MVCTYTNLILCANHTERVLAAQFAFLDSETLVAVIQHGTNRCHNDLLTGSHIRRTADNRQHFVAHIDGRDMQVVGIRVGFTCQHLAYHQTFQSAANGLNRLHCTYLETDRSKDFRHCLCIVLQGNVAL